MKHSPEKYKKVIIRSILLYTGLFCFLYASAQQVSETRINNTCFLNYISIEGATNVNSFYFTYQHKAKNTYSSNTAECTNDADSGTVNFYIPVKSFEGSNPAMLSDFQTLLKASQFPKVVVGVKKKLLNGIVSGDTYSDKLNLYLTMAGVTRPIDAEYTTHYLRNGNVLLSGITRIRLTDFSLDPPKRMLGIIKVENMVFIKFELILPSQKSVINKS